MLQQSTQGSVEAAGPNTAKFIEQKSMRVEAMPSEKFDKEDVEPIISDSTISDTTDKTTEHAPMKIVWKNVFIFSLIHIFSLYGIYRMITSAKWQTNVFSFFLYVFSGMGVTAGAHRLWAHRSYKAKLPLRILLAFMFTMAFERDIFDWSRDHRVHHKYSDTDADPYNAKRGFFFAHVGWVLCRKHPEVIRKGKTIDLSDLLADPVVRFNRKYYLWLVLLCSVFLPTFIPMYFWDETLLNSFLIATVFRMCFTHHQTWLVNSAAHMWGNRPYDVHINPRESVLAIIGTIGEGFHNYHHTFPYDYAASEYGVKYNLTTLLIDVMSWFGLAYDKKVVSKDMIKARKLRTGVDYLKKLEQEKAQDIKEE